MPLIIIIAALIPLRYFEVWKFADMSWWWVIGAMGFAFIWFEFIEKCWASTEEAHAAGPCIAGRAIVGVWSPVAARQQLWRSIYGSNWARASWAWTPRSPTWTCRSPQS